MVVAAANPCPISVNSLHLEDDRPLTEVGLLSPYQLFASGFILVIGKSVLQHLKQKERDFSKELLGDSLSA